MTDPSQALSHAERLKFALWAEGLTLSTAAARELDRLSHGRPITPADYASTSGLILRLEDDVWINAPIAYYNPNFVTNPPFALDLDADGFNVRGNGLVVRAGVWLPPLYHGENNSWGESYNSYAFTHADRVRISPIEGCAITCTFCDLPYEFKYRRKRIEGIVNSVRRALGDDLQPAHHVLISGGTPRVEDYNYLRDVYNSVLESFPGLPIDIMMAPMEGLLDLTRLKMLGINELSINIEIWDEGVARRVMPKKYRQGKAYYLEFIAKSVAVLGKGRVRSMLIAGLEPMESTLEAIDAIAELGATPVFEPFPTRSQDTDARRSTANRGISSGTVSTG